jgi:microcystin-dependent protein
VSGETVTPAKLNSAAAPTVVVADGEVTVAKLAAAVQQLLVPAGAVQAFAMNSAPTGWLAADGTAVSRTDYAALFTAIGTTYGVGDGSTTFALPDLRGYFVRGSGTNSDSTASGTFGAKQAGTEVYDQYDNGRVPDLSNAVFNDDGSVARNVQVISNVSNTGGLPTVSRNFAKVRPANIAMLYCIKF